ncbi:hypothetical protein ABLN64_15995, partial [Mycobacterium tuberculosis]
CTSFGYQMWCVNRTTHTRVSFRIYRGCFRVFRAPLQSDKELSPIPACWFGGSIGDTVKPADLPEVLGD